MIRLRMLAIFTVLLIVVNMSGCAGETIHSGAGLTNESVSSETQEPGRIIDEETFSPDIGLDGVVMEVDQDFATSYGAFVEITNGFDNGQIYFDRSYRLQQFTDGEWADIPLIGPDNFPNETKSLAARQKVPVNIYWPWLYGELSPGEYRIVKSFLQRSDDGEDLQHEAFATFLLDGGSVLDSVRRGYSVVVNPLSGVTTFRAEVTELLDSDFHHVSMGNIGLLVDSVAPFWGSSGTGDPFYIWDNNSVIVLDTAGQQIRFSDIRQYDVLDITFSGMILDSYPAHIGGTLLIQIVGFAAAG